MRKASILLTLTILLFAAAILTLSSPSLAQGDPPPRGPWVGPNTPWTFFHGDWFRNGELHYFYGPKHGWAPYYSRPVGPVERPNEWYGQKWENWNREHPNYQQHFEREYPYWREHRTGERYDENFYNRYHHGRGVVGNSLTEAMNKGSLASIEPNLLAEH